jgi:gamma-glutamylcyclotransferase (GGCT)/AIG2-like uncharacterized protein YtfP
MPTCWVYGTLKRERSNHHYLKSATFKGTLILPFNARMICVGFPVILDDAAPILVEGEVYEVDNATFERLDRLEGEGHMYKRRRKRIGGGRRAWVYIGASQFWERRAGQPVTPDFDNVIRWSGRR